MLKKGNFQRVVIVLRDQKKGTGTRTRLHLTLSEGKGTRIRLFCGFAFLFVLGLCFEVTQKTKVQGVVYCLLLFVLRFIHPQGKKPKTQRLRSSLTTDHLLHRTESV